MLDRRHTCTYYKPLALSGLSMKQNFMDAVSTDFAHNFHHKTILGTVNTPGK
jgi:hypothetical protein